MDVTIRKATLEDARYVAANLRSDDRREIEALGLDPAFAVEYSFTGSDEVYTGCVDGVPALIFGTGAPTFSDEASVWALGTSLCDKVPLAMVRLGRKMVGKFLEQYSVLENHCDARYKKTIKWLRLIGFTVGDPEPYGDKGALFCKLTIHKEE